MGMVIEVSVVGDGGPNGVDGFTWEGGQWPS